MRVERTEYDEVTEQPYWRDPLSVRILMIVSQAQREREGRGIELAEIVGHFSGAIGRRIAPDRQTVADCVGELVEREYLRIDRWNRFRLTPRGWTDGMQYPAETYLWDE
jgi:hypothetical protein